MALRGLSERLGLDTDQMYLDSRARYYNRKGLGIKAIYRKLSPKFDALKKEDLVQTLGDYAESTTQQIDALLQKHTCRPKKNEDPRKYRARVIRFLLARGHDLGDILPAIQNIQPETDDDDGTGLT